MGVQKEKGGLTGFKKSLPGIHPGSTQVNSPFAEKRKTANGQRIGETKRKDWAASLGILIESKEVRLPQAAKLKQPRRRDRIGAKGSKRANRC